MLVNRVVEMGVPVAGAHGIETAMPLWIDGDDAHVPAGHVVVATVGLLVATLLALLFA